MWKGKKILLAYDAEVWGPLNALCMRKVNQDSIPLDMQIRGLARSLHWLEKNFQM